MNSLLKWLIERGAQLVGTESTELLIKEYEAVKRSLADGNFHETDKPNESQQNDDTVSLLTQRDCFIAQRIVETLHVGNVGILFIGLQHRVQDYLPGDLVVEYPFGRAKDHERPRIFEPSS